MTFEESYKYLLSLGNEVSAMKLGLESMTTLIGGMGKPCANTFKVQVAGTNGKGSVCAFLNSICVTAGLTTGMFTSPHLMSVTERIQLNNKPISEREFAGLASFVRDTAEWLVARGDLSSVPTYFEQVTAIALVHFANNGVDLAILETGLGGRLDATTAAKADVAVITRIDLDHQQYLGDTIEQIAAEKAAIMRRGSNVVIGEQTIEAMRVIENRCVDLAITPRLAKTVQIERNGGVMFRTERENYHVDSLGLIGDHQIENAKTAILAAELLSERFAISRRDIEMGLANARHPGRLEFNGRYLFDGAHNIGGAKALRRFLDEEIDKPVTIIFGAMKDKDVEAIAEILFPAATSIVLTRPKNERAMDISELESIASKTVKHANIITSSSVVDAIAKAETICKEDSIILVTGSLYLVGEAKQLLEQKTKV